MEWANCVSGVSHARIPRTARWDGACTAHPASIRPALTLVRQPVGDKRPPRLAASYQILMRAEVGGIMIREL
jgi:hypothetical protein